MPTSSHKACPEFHSEDTAIAAAEIMLARLRELAEQRQSFAFETSLAASQTFIVDQDAVRIKLYISPHIPLASQC